MTQTGSRLSVALVTRNRPRQLERALTSLRAQAVQPWEVLVSDDSDDARRAEVAAVAARFGCRYQHGPRRGLYANRNASILACRGTHVRTMDDDHELPPGHFAACMAMLARDPGALWAISERQPWREGPLAAAGELHPRGFMTPALDGWWPAALADGSTIYPRAVFEAGLRFDESFRFGYVYLEFASLLWTLGCRCRITSETWIVHHADPDDLVRPTTQDSRAARLMALALLALRRPRLSYLWWVGIEWARVAATKETRTACLPAVRAVTRRRRDVRALAIVRDDARARLDPHHVFGRRDDLPPPVAGLSGLRPSLRLTPVGLYRLARFLRREDDDRWSARLVAASRVLFGVQLSADAEVGPGLRLVRGGRGVVVEAGARIGTEVDLLPRARVVGGQAVADRTVVRPEASGSRRRSCSPG